MTAPPRGHVLFVSRQRIAGRTNGSSAYLIDLATAVRDAGFVPHLLQPSPDLLGRWPIMRLQPDMGVFASHSIRGVIRLGRWVIARDPRVALSALWALTSRMARRFGLDRGGRMHRLLADRPRPYAIAADWTAADRAFLHEFASRAPGAQAGIVIADYAFQAEAFDLLPGRPGAIVMHDLFHARTDAQGRDSVIRVGRDQEIALLTRADAVIAIQADEARFIAENVPGPIPILAPMAARPAAQAEPGDGRRLLFVGSNTAPNVVALEWFFARVWPLLQEAEPELRLDVVGAVAAGFAQGGPQGVTFHGQVSDLGPYYARAGIVISPLTFGSGLKVKLVEALALGKAMVVTGVTLQGVERTCGPAVLRADKAEDFARAVIELTDDARRAALAQRALDVARAHFSPDVCHAAFREWLIAQASPGATRRKTRA